MKLLDSALDLTVGRSPLILSRDNPQGFSCPQYESPFRIVQLATVVLLVSLAADSASATTKSRHPHSTGHRASVSNLLSMISAVGSWPDSLVEVRAEQYKEVEEELKLGNVSTVSPRLKLAVKVETLSMLSSNQCSTALPRAARP